jgi:hypothetical protein
MSDGEVRVLNPGQKLSNYLPTKFFISEDTGPFEARREVH